jgi:FkbM family methyltransferase
MNEFIVDKYEKIISEQNTIIKYLAQENDYVKQKLNEIESNQTPIVVISYNNYKYVDNTLKQILKLNKKYYKNIKILDNCSTCEETINYLKNVDVDVIINKTNNGPWINTTTNSDIYHSLPDKFILTDPDLELNENIPFNFIETLSYLSDKYKCNKIGFALDLSDFDKMYQTNYIFGHNTYNWEIRHWINKLEDENYELYRVPIDTTFCLINKKQINNDNNCLRIAGNFTAKHLPWYINNKVYNVYENYKTNSITTSISNMAKVIVDYIDNNYLKVKKNNELFFIENNNNKPNPNLQFWENVYSNWRVDTFNLLDKFLDKNKIFIDVGGWIGLTTLYGTRKSKHVYAVDADFESFNYMKSNLETNCNNYTLINKLLYNIDDIDIHSDINNLDNDLNNIIYQIYENENLNDNNIINNCCTIKSITIQSLFETNNINPEDISLINVDMMGGEEIILNDLYLTHIKYQIPIHINFNIDNWKDKNLDRFDFLTQIQKDSMEKQPIASIFYKPSIIS